MRPSRRPLRIITRKSHLAQVQANAVAQVLAQLHRDTEIQVITTESQGDRVLDRSLADIGGKGLFSQSLEQALLNHEADVAVHCLKDLPTQTTSGLLLTAVIARGPIEDVLVTSDARKLESLAHGATIGTSSPRRTAQLKRLRPDLDIRLLRGNIETRLARVLEGDTLDAAVLARAGLERLKIACDCYSVIDVEQMLPAAAQGALALQCRADDHVTMRRCLGLNDPKTSLEVGVERSIVDMLHADCHSPIAVLAESDGAQQLRLRAMVMSLDATESAEIDIIGDTNDTHALLEESRVALSAQNAVEILQRASATHRDLAPSS